MNTKELALLIALTAVTVVLSPRVSGIAIPYVIVPALWFQIWEIVIVASFFLIGFKRAIAISILNTIVLQALYPGTPFNQPIANLVAVLGTLLGVYVASTLIRRKTFKGKSISKKKNVALYTAFGIIFRLAIMLPFLYSVALILGMSAVIVMFPFFAIYDLIVAFYAVPLGYLVYSLVKKRFALEKLNFYY